MGGRYKDFNRVKTEEDMINNPGPGFYEGRQLFSPRGHNTAGYKSPPSVVYSPRSEKRFFELSIIFYRFRIQNSLAQDSISKLIVCLVIDTMYPPIYNAMALDYSRNNSEN